MVTLCARNATCSIRPHCFSDHKALWTASSMTLRLHAVSGELLYMWFGLLTTPTMDGSFLSTNSGDLGGGTKGVDSRTFYNSA